ERWIRNTYEGRCARQRADRPRSFELVDVVTARQVCAAAEEVAHFNAVAGAQVALHCKAGLLRRRIPIIRPDAEAHFEWTAGPGHKTELRQVRGGNRALADNALRQQRLVKLDRGWQPERVRSRRSQHDVDIAGTAQPAQLVDDVDDLIVNRANEDPVAAANRHLAVVSRITRKPQTRLNVLIVGRHRLSIVLDVIPHSVIQGEVRAQLPRVLSIERTAMTPRREAR